jgi:menaquinone-dependent protoporphyrinogen oxidase
MKALVTVSSRHGSTTEIGAAIADAFRTAGLDVDLISPGQVASLDGYDAVVVGSGIYMGRWLAPARDFVTGHFDELRGKAVWLFSSGPVTGADDPADSAEGLKLLELVGGREHRLFAGRLEKEGLSFTERTLARMIKSPWGDYRPWDAIREWAASIAETLSAVPAGAR